MLALFLPIYLSRPGLHPFDSQTSTDEIGSEIFSGHLSGDVVSAPALMRSMLANKFDLVVHILIITIKFRSAYCLLIPKRMDN